MKRYLIIVLLLALGIPIVHAQDGGTLTVSILAQNVEFPAVDLTLGVYQNGQPVLGLTTENFTISGDTPKDLRLEPAEGPLNLGVVIDLSTSAVPDTVYLSPIKTALRTYFSVENNFYREGDRVAFVVMRNRQATLSEATTREEIEALIEGLSNPAGTNVYSSGIEQAAQKLVEYGQSGQILVIGAYPGNLTGRLEEFSGIGETMFTRYGLPINTIHAYTPGNYSSYGNFFQSMAEQGRGGYAGYDNSNPNGMRSLFENMQAGRMVYKLAYTSDDVTEGERAVQVTVNANEQSAGGSFGYTPPVLDPPLVAILSPTDSTPVVRTPQGAAGSPLGPATQTVEAQVIIPGDLPRAITQAELVIEGQVVDTENDPFVDNNNIIRLIWDLSDYGADGISQQLSVALAVRVTDSYGKEAISPTVNVPISIVIPDAGGVVVPPAAGNPTVPVIEVPDGIVPNVEIPTTAPATANTEVAEDTSSDKGIPVIAIVGVLGGVIFIMFVLVLIQQRRLRYVTYGVQETMMGAMNTMTGRHQVPADLNKTVISGTDGQVAGPIAQLEVLSGPLKGQMTPMEKPVFVIGREAGPDIQLETTGFRNVSSRHCQVSFNNGQFRIMDLGSTNGTYLNGQRLAPNIETVLPAQALVQLGKDASISFQFRFFPQQKVAGGGGGGLHKTMVEDEGGPPPQPIGAKQNWHMGKTQTFDDAAAPAPSQPAAPPPPAQQPYSQPPIQPYQNPYQQPYQQQPPPPQRSDWDDWGQVNADDDWVNQ